jgi:hypothetical protein
VSALLDRIGERASKEKGEQFTNLLSHIKVPLLRRAFTRLRKDAAAGVDRETWSSYSKDLEARLLDLQDRVQRGAYHPPPVRRVYIPKGDGQTRPLGIPTVEDKLLQEAVRMLLQPIYESDFVGFSYGFRPGRSQHMALDALYVALHRKVNWVLDADIRSFFDTIDPEWLKRFVEHRIGDRRLVRLLMKWLHAGVVEAGELHEVQRGTPQGGTITPPTQLTKPEIAGLPAGIVLPTRGRVRRGARAGRVRSWSARRSAWRNAVHDRCAIRLDLYTGNKCSDQLSSLQPAEVAQSVAHAFPECF